MKVDSVEPGRGAHFIFKLPSSSPFQCSTDNNSQNRGLVQAQSQNIPRARLSTVENCQAQSSMVKTCLEHGRNIP